MHFIRYKEGLLSGSKPKWLRSRKSSYDFERLRGVFMVSE